MLLRPPLPHFFRLLVSICCSCSRCASSCTWSSHTLGTLAVSGQDQDWHQTSTGARCSVVSPVLHPRRGIREGPDGPNGPETSSSRVRDELPLPCVPPVLERHRSSQVRRDLTSDHLRHSSLVPSATLPEEAQPRGVRGCWGWPRRSLLPCFLRTLTFASKVDTSCQRCLLRH